MKPNNVKYSHWITYNTLFFLEHFLGEKWYPKLFGNTEKKLYRNIDKYATAHPIDGEFKILEYAKGNYSEPHCHPYYPLVYRGIANNWPCVEKWSLEFFSEKFGSMDVTLVTKQGAVKNPKPNYVTLKFREYIANLKSGSKDYLKFSPIVDEHSELRGDFDYVWIEKFRTALAKKAFSYFFMGGQDTMTPLHNGYALTVFVNVKGTKKWTFYSCNQRLFIGVRPRREDHFYTYADPSNIYDPRFPLLKHAQKLEVLTHPGDILYIPSLLWHQVENVTDTLGVAFNFTDIRYGFVSSKTLAACFFLSTRPWFLETLLNLNSNVYNYTNYKY